MTYVHDACTHVHDAFTHVHDVMCRFCIQACLRSFRHTPILTTPNIGKRGPSLGCRLRCHKALPTASTSSITWKAPTLAIWRCGRMMKRFGGAKEVGGARVLLLLLLLVPNHFEWFGDYSVWSCPSVRVSVSVSVRVSVRGQTLYAHLLLAATFQQVDTYTIWKHINWSSGPGNFKVIGSNRCQKSAKNKTKFFIFYTHISS